MARVATKLIREAALEAIGRGETTWNKLALAKGWERRSLQFRKRGILYTYRVPQINGDGARVKRALGALAHSPNRPGQEPYWRESMDEEEALEWCALLHLDPVDVGL